jgi:hypothetical protein
MCECPCGEFDSVAAFALGEHVVAIERYPGCDNCHTPTGVAVHVVTPERAQDWEITPTEEAALGDFGWWQIAIPLVGVGELVDAAEEMEKRGEIDPSDYDSLADLLETHGHDLVRGALQRSWEKWLRGREKK